MRIICIFWKHDIGWKMFTTCVTVDEFMSMEEKLSLDENGVLEKLK